MKTAFSTIALLCLTAFFSVAQSIPPSLPAAPADKAVVYFVRLGVLGSAVRFPHFDGDRFIGKFGGGQYLRYECTPGDHLFWAHSEKNDYVPAHLEAGEVYLVESIVAAGIGKTRVKLLPMDPNEVKRIHRMERKILRKKGLKTSPEKLAAQTEKRQKSIQHGLDKYAKLAQEGREFRQLRPEMSVGNYHR